MKQSRRKMANDLIGLALGKVKKKKKKTILNRTPNRPKNWAYKVLQEVRLQVGLK